MSLAELGSFALLISLVYWWFLMWHSFKLTRKTLVILNTVGTALMTILTWPITYGMLLIPILIIYAVSTFNDKWYCSDLELPAKNYADKGDLLYTWATAFGPHIWKGPKVIYHYHIWKVETTSDISKNFAVHLLDADQAQMTNSLNSSTMVHITKGTMENKIVTIPGISEQRNMARLLDQLDCTIALHQRKLEKLQELKKGYLQKMFC
ncbi:restriction endonuclease subunit S [Levilactobacillus brevis]